MQKRASINPLMVKLILCERVNITNLATSFISIWLSLSYIPPIFPCCLIIQIETKRNISCDWYIRYQNDIRLVFSIYIYILDDFEIIGIRLRRWIDSNVKDYVITSNYPSWYKMTWCVQASVQLNKNSCIVAHPNPFDMVDIKIPFRLFCFIFIVKITHHLIC